MQIRTGEINIPTPASAGNGGPSNNIGDDFESFKAGLPQGSGAGENDMGYYLQLQQQTLAETRAFETFSNIMKARHDAASNAIRNLH